MIVCADVTLASARSQWRNAILFAQEPGKRERLVIEGAVGGHQHLLDGGWELKIYGNCRMICIALHAPHGVQPACAPS